MLTQLPALITPPQKIPARNISFRLYNKKGITYFMNVNFYQKLTWKHTQISSNKQLYQIEQIYEWELEIWVGIVQTIWHLENIVGLICNTVESTLIKVNDLWVKNNPVWSCIYQEKINNNWSVSFLHHISLVSIGLFLFIPIGLFFFISFMFSFSFPLTFSFSASDIILLICNEPASSCIELDLVSVYNLISTKIAVKKYQELTLEDVLMRQEIYT